MEFMVNFVVGLALFSGSSYQDVVEHMIGAFPWLGPSAPNKSSLTRARRRLGPEVLRRIYEELAGPVAVAGDPGAFYRGMRLGSVDGMQLDAPESAANRARFGGQHQTPELPRGLPVVRVVSLTETGTRAQMAAGVGGFHDSERLMARDLAPAAAGMLVIIDALFPDVKLWQTFDGSGAHLLVRASTRVAAVPEHVLEDGTYLTRMRRSGYKGNTAQSVLVRVIDYQVDGGERFRLLTSLHDPQAHPVRDLIALYPERWESEGANRQIKSFQRGDRAVLRSTHPDLIEQEIWAHLIVHTTITKIITGAAQAAGIDPRRLSYTKTLTQVRLAVTRQAPTTDTAQTGPDDTTPTTPGTFIQTLATRAKRLLDNGIKRPRASPRQISSARPTYPHRPIADKLKQRTYKTTPKTITLPPQPILA